LGLPRRLFDRVGCAQRPPRPPDREAALRQTPISRIRAPDCRAPTHHRERHYGHEIEENSRLQTRVSSQNRARACKRKKPFASAWACQGERSASRIAATLREGELARTGPDWPVIRRASGHGLGHLLAPYDESSAERRARIERIGVPLWQEDLWKEIIRAADTGTPDQTRSMDMPGFDAPAASQYAAASRRTKREILASLRSRFAPFRGGPLHYARTRGVENVIFAQRELTKKFGERFAPDAGWDRLSLKQ
jgi:hypothetical protein